MTATDSAAYPLPEIVVRATWQAQIDRLLAREKAHTREGDQIAAARRSLPMVEVDAATPLIGQHGQVPLLNVFEGRRQRRTVEHRTEVIPLAQLGLAGRQSHPHRQLQCPLRSERGIHCGSRRGERRAHPVAGVLEHVSAVRLNRPVQHLVMGGQRHPHPIGVSVPPTGRTLDIGEQKRHHPRRSSRPISGHHRRISHRQAPTSHIGGSIRPGHRIHVF